MLMMEELDKLLKARFIKFIEKAKQVSTMIVTLKKASKPWVCINYKMLNKVPINDGSTLPFCEKILMLMARHQIFTFGNGYNAYHQVKIAYEDSTQDHIHNTIKNFLS